MKKKMFLVTISITCLVSCNSNGFDYKTLCIKEANASIKRNYNEYKTYDYKLFKNGLNKFTNNVTTDFYAYNGNDDFLFSPTTLFNCISLLAPLVNNEIESEILNVLNLDKKTLYNNYATYFDSMIKNQEKFKENVTNSVWIRNNLSYYQDPVDTLSDNFRTSSFLFEPNDTKTLKNALNSFIKDKTNNLLNAENIEIKPEIALLLLSTLYIKDIWNEAGDELTFYKDKIDFVNHDGSITKTSMLSGYYNDGRVYKTEDFSKFYTRFYSGTKLSFIIPNENKSINDILNSKNIDEILHFNDYVDYDETLEEAYRTKVIFPEFKANTNYELSNFIREKLGLESLFNEEKSDIFSKFTDNSLKVSSVIQENKLEVDKKGVEGASYTLIMVEGDISSTRSFKTVYDTLIVDKEFIYVLEDDNDNVLFVGTLSSL